MAGMIQPLLLFGDWGLLFLRIVLGVILLMHGWNKVKNFGGTAGFLGSAGFKPARFWASVVIAAEVGGGILLALGFLTQIVAAILAVQFIVILFTVKRGKPLVDGYEFDLVILAGLLVLLTIGGGQYSLDSSLGFVLYY